MPTRARSILALTVLVFTVTSMGKKGKKNAKGKKVVKSQEFSTAAVAKHLQIGVIINAPLPTDSNEILAQSIPTVVPVSRTCFTLIPEDGRPKDVIGIVTGE